VPDAQRVENAAAQRGFLVVPREGRLVVSAAVSVEPDQVRLGLAEDLETSHDLPRLSSTTWRGA
jgi:hypothetical protein